MRSGSWPLLGAVAGVAAGLVVTLLQGPSYRADASVVLVREGQPPGDDPKLADAAEAAAELFESRAVAASAARNLGVANLGEVEAETEPGSSLVRLEVEAESKEAARRAAQEVAEVATVLFNDRFGPRTVASVWEPAEADPDQLAPRPARNLALGALAGALAGWALLLLVRRPQQQPRPKRPEGTVPGPVPVAAHEPSKARAAPAPPTAPVPRGRVPGTVPETRPVRPQPIAERPAPQPFVLPALGEWTIGDVERLVAEQGDAFPERQEEIQLYLETLRDVAGPDGRLPGDVDLVIEDVYADLIERSGSARRG